MKNMTDGNITEKQMKRLLARLETEPVDIYPGYNSGLVLPSDTPLGLIITKPIHELLPLCKFDKNSDLSAFFTVYPKGKDNAMFEISFKKSGKYVYKNNKKFENPPLFDELFATVRYTYLANIIQDTTQNFEAALFFYRCQTLVLKRLMIEQAKIKD